MKFRQLRGNAFLGTSEGQQVEPGCLEFSNDNMVDFSMDSASLEFSGSSESEFDFEINLFRLVVWLLLLPATLFMVFFLFILKWYKVKI